MQISGLQHFVELAEAGSYYQAEKAGGEISAQAYSKLVSSLEHELGVRLVKTSRKGIELTPEGGVFLEFARSTLDEYAKLQMRLGDAHRPVRPNPTVVYATFYAATVLSELIPQGLVPGDIQVREEPFDAVLERAQRLRENEVALVDLQDGRGQNDLRSRGLSFRHIATCSPMAVVKEDSALARLGRPLEVSDLWGVRIVCNSHPEMLHKYRKIFSMLPREAEVVRFSSVRGLWEYLKVNPDCAFLADSVQATLRDGLKQPVGDGFVFVPIAANYSPAKLGLLGARRERKSPQAAELARVLRDALAGVQGEGTRAETRPAGL